MTEMTIDTTHGKCNAVYVAIPPSTDQFSALTEYAIQFKVCVCVCVCENL